MKRFILLAALFAGVAQAQTDTVKIPFDACISRIREMGSRFGVTPINIVETRELRVVRFITSDGSVLVSCSRPDQNMVVKISK
jgi:hypothetical protein